MCVYLSTVAIAIAVTAFRVSDAHGLVQQCKQGVLYRQVDLQGVFVKIGEFFVRFEVSSGNSRE